MIFFLVYIDLIFSWALLISSCSSRQWKVHCLCWFCYRNIKKTRFYFLLIHSLRSVCHSWMYIVHTYNLTPWEGAQISGLDGHSSRPSLKDRFIFAMLASILSTWETMGNKTRYSSARLQRNGQCVSSQEKWRKHNRYGKVWRIDKGSSGEPWSTLVDFPSHRRFRLHVNEIDMSHPKKISDYIVKKRWYKERVKA